MLVRGASEAVQKVGATYDHVTVPGALEIPAVVAMAAGTGKYDAFVALGCVIRSNNYHFEVVCNESARGLGELAIKNNLAIGNGILTVENKEQAIDRADPNKKNRGADAVNAALAVLELKRKWGA
ncbi:MAG: 6,7-dimethyl-8-ribityllumazine synthase, partial [Alphaproteobacteria bacterium]